MTQIIKKVTRFPLDIVKAHPDYFGGIAAAYGLTSIQILLQIVLIPLYLNYLGKPLFGVLMVLIAYVNVSQIGIAWLSHYLMRNLAARTALQGGAEFHLERGIFRPVYLFYSLAAGSALVVIGFFAPDLLIGDAGGTNRGGLNSAFVAAAIYLVFLIMTVIDISSMVAAKMRTQVGLLQIYSVIIFAVTVIPTLYFGGGIAGVMGCLTLGSLTIIVGARIYLKNRFPKSPVSSSDGFRKKFRQVFGSNSGGFAVYGGLNLVRQADALVLGILGGAEVVADYVLVWRVAEVIVVLIRHLSSALQPELVEMDVLGAQRRRRRIVTLGGWAIRGISLAGGIAYALLGPTIVYLWIGEAGPDEILAYLMAGGAIFWLGSADFSIVCALSWLLLKPLNATMLVEVILRLAVTLAAFPFLGYYAPIFAVNMVHVSGVAFVYGYIVRRRSSLFDRDRATS